ncbi:hypothetical protein M7I_5351 [Glarea lozoyensis 74030]|uniref:Uncharacterized protein n=1 Tax=Glarea lozoyensis (strain ATCC 74030 / MF5533) TaxID=1104152 RepID=H0ERN0_GLAL7|nr:hypothetical protein M7I_5351 [Glarea lozoyensis 74030]
MTSHNNKNNNKDNQTNHPTRSYEDFTCPTCFRTISADRFPILNLENCSCIDTTTANSPPKNDYNPESPPSSANSVPPEARNQNTFRSLAPSPSLGQTEQTHPAISYPLHQYLTEQTQEYECVPVQMERETRMDMQVDSMAKGKISKKSSEGSDRTWIGYGGAEMAGLGGWVEGVGLGILGQDGYPLVMSGLMVDTIYLGSE